MDNAITTADPPKRLAYKPGEVGRLLGIGEKAVRRLVRAGRLQSVRLGGRNMLITANSLDEYLQGDAA